LRTAGDCGSPFTPAACELQPSCANCKPLAGRSSPPHQLQQAGPPPSVDASTTSRGQHQQQQRQPCHQPQQHGQQLVGPGGAGAGASPCCMWWRWRPHQQSQQLQQGREASRMAERLPQPAPATPAGNQHDGLPRRRGPPTPVPAAAASPSAPLQQPAKVCVRGADASRWLRGRGPRANSCLWLRLR
jgi:hypothetical protein